ncbi:MAG: L,D-transpeptidase [Devosiaceae bacterium]|nr:L,D-transpeptidase [Devosiaceae bacterium]
MRQQLTTSRRSFMLGAACALTGASLPGFAMAATKQEQLDEAAKYHEMYGAMPNERFPIPAVDLRLIDPAYLRRFGDYQSTEMPGTVIVDTAQKVLFLTLPEGKAIRYGIGIGRAGFEWSGRALINHKKMWPTWTPPSEMIEREPELEEWRRGMPPSLENPLGARALYIFQDGRDTLYRVHGTGDAQSIGFAVSSGCVRLLHQDVIDLYNRVPNKTPIVVI